MNEYEVTGYIQIPVSVWVKADTPAEAYLKGSADLDMGLGLHGDQYWQDEYTVWDTTNDQPVPEALWLAASN